MILTRQLFLRLLGAVWLVATVSLWWQVSGLVGREGILPAAELAEAVRLRYGSAWVTEAPSLFWLWPSDAWLHVLCAAGVGLSLCVLADVLVAPALLGLYAVYLSLMTISGVFLGYQWDTLLLEGTVAAVLVAPWGLRRGVGAAPSPFGVWLIRWLVVRLMFFAGWVKLASGDPTWADLSAMTYHYWTQPLPNPVSWYVDRLPDWLHALSAVGMFLVELALPVAVFFGRVPRLVAFCGFAALMAGLQLTGNFGFFQVLTVALAVMLLDDGFVGKVIPSRWLVREVRPTTAVRDALVAPVAAVLFGLSSLHAAGQLAGYEALPRPALTALRETAPFRVVNRYGLFAVMTTSRPEIRVEGSRDGRTWEPYVFRYKPGPLDRPPPLVAPHMPRLDWQLWFAALGTCDRNPWLRRLMQRLAEGSAPVERLLLHDPFGDDPPRYVRAVRTEYRFGEDAWWVELGEPRPYCPVIAR